MDIGGDRQYFSAYQKCSKPRSLLQQKQTLESCYQSNINTRLSASIREHNCIFWCVFIFLVLIIPLCTTLIKLIYINS